MGYITGESAAIDGFVCLKKFEILTIGDAADAICTANPAGVVGVVGNDDWFGRAIGYGASPAKYPGQTFTFTGVLSNGTGRSGAAIVQSVRMRWEVEAATPLEHDIMFASNGALSEVTGSSVTDTGAPSGVSAKGMGLRIDGTLFNVRRMMLQIDCKNALYNDTGTAGHTARLRGTFHGKFQVEAYYDDPADLPAKHTYKQLIFQTETGADSTVGWALNYGLIRNVRDNINTYGTGDGRAEAVYALIEGQWSSYYGTNQGYIKMPDDTQIWPLA